MSPVPLINFGWNNTKSDDNVMNAIDDEQTTPLNVLLDPLKPHNRCELIKNTDKKHIHIYHWYCRRVIHMGFGKNGRVFMKNG